MATDYFLLALLLIILVTNAIVSGSKVAFFTIEKQPPDEFHHKNQVATDRVNRLLDKPEKLHASIVITYGLLNVTLTVLIIYLLNRFPYFMGYPYGTLLLEIGIAVGIILFFVDILPKMYASHAPFRFATRHSRFIEVLHKLMSPLSSILVRGSASITRSALQKRNDISVDDLSKALEITSNEITREQEKEMLEGIIRFKDKTVDDILVSRSDMVVIDARTPFNVVIDFIVDAGYSRIPIFDDTPDNIQGILYVKDLLPHLGQKPDFNWQSLIRPAYFVPGTKRIDDLLEEFRDNKNHMAIVVDEYGGTSGLVTMEDILEEIVGDISDEYDEEQPLYSIAADGSYLFEGKTPLEDFVKITGVEERDFKEMAEEVDTLAGLLLELKGDFPKRKESFTYKKYTFVAEEMSKKRVVKVRYVVPKRPTNTDAN
ncbi:MAG TPA: gliding motility-associated protein GldE [Bacteroidales bacterium]|nr:gliding motility-associated protein GldE [Bacteroidales bacterium]